MISTYSVKLPTTLAANKECTNQQQSITFEYTALYPTSARKSPTLAEQKLIKQAALTRIKHYYQLSANFDLRHCLKDEKIATQKKYNINLNKDSTDLLQEANKLQDLKPEIQFEIREK